MWRSGDHLLRSLSRDRLLVTLKDGQTFQGLFNGADRQHVRLIKVEYVRVEGNTAADGEVFIPRDHIAYIQRP